jgi:hypothetical protein
MKMNTDKSARTPGPWTVEFGEAMYVRAPDGSHIAIMGQLTAHARRDANESAANARLIAAAPALVEALEAVKARTDKIYTMGHEEARRAAVDCYEIARAALSLAGVSRG